MSTAVGIATAVAVSNGGQAVANSGSSTLMAWYGVTIIQVVVFGLWSLSLAYKDGRRNEARSVACWYAIGFAFFCNFWYAWAWTREDATYVGFSILTSSLAWACIVGFAGYLEAPKDIKAMNDAADAEELERNALRAKHESEGKVVKEGDENEFIASERFFPGINAWNNMMLTYLGNMATRRPTEEEIFYANARNSMLTLYIAGVIGFTITANVLVFL